jgi:hypothetical protein
VRCRDAPIDCNDRNRLSVDSRTSQIGMGMRRMQLRHGSTRVQKDCAVTLVERPRVQGLGSDEGDVSARSACVLGKFRQR